MTDGILVPTNALVSASSSVLLLFALLGPICSRRLCFCVISAHSVYVVLARSGEPARIFPEAEGNGGSMGGVSVGI